MGLALLCALSVRAWRPASRDGMGLTRCSRLVELHDESPARSCKNFMYVHGPQTISMSRFGCSKPNVG